MRLKNIIKDLRDNGLISVMKKCWMFFLRCFVYYKELIYCCDLVEFNKQINIPDERKIECFSSEDDINDTDLKRLVEYRDKDLLMNQCRERFTLGAKMWIIRVDGKIANFQWSIRHKPLEHYFFPLTENDVYFFDAVTFPDCRGKGLNSDSMDYFLAELKKEGMQRAYLSINSWNKPVARAMLKMPYKVIGVAKKMHIWRWDLVVWFKMSK
jgi:RimJ/RimL family protein N-acetyltransferase